MEKTKRRAGLICAGAVFAAMFVYFTEIHPLMLFDSDDWANISQLRYAIPIRVAWNPTKILPETLLPLCGNIAAHVIYPMTGDYLRAITLVCASTVSISIAAYVYMFSKVLSRKFELTEYQVLLGTLVFFLLHFLLFRKWESRNLHMLYSPSITNYFHYTIPYLLNASLVMYLLIDDVLNDGWEKLKGGFYKRYSVKISCLILVLYLAMFSNIFCNALLVVYVGLQMLGDVFSMLRRGEKFSEYLKRNVFRVAVIFLWCVTLLFERTGGRSGSFGMANGQMIENVKESLHSFISLWKSVNSFFLVLSVAIVVITVIVFYQNRKCGGVNCDCESQIMRVLLRIVVMGFLMAVYLIMLCAMTAPMYINRTDVNYGVCFCLILFVSLCGAYILSKTNTATIVLPILTYMIVFAIDTKLPTFMDSNAYVEYSIGAAISEDIVQQFVDADKAGVTDITLHIPQFNQSDNWPLLSTGGDRIARTLYKHGVISREMTSVVVVLDEMKNAEFNIPLQQ